jgi:hypothetical protein
MDDVLTGLTSRFGKPVLGEGLAVDHEVDLPLSRATSHHCIRLTALFLQTTLSSLLCARLAHAKNSGSSRQPSPSNIEDLVLTATRLHVACLPLDVTSDASEKEVELRQSALHGFDEPLVAGTPEHRIADHQRLTCAGRPAIHSAQPSIPLDSSHGTRVEFIVDDMPAIAMKIKAFTESIRRDEDIGPKWG